MKAAVIYARVSTVDQAEHGTSLESQVEACQAYAAQNGYNILEVFKESRSGASLDRPMLERVRELARQNAIDAVIFYALDRLSRDDTDTLILAKEWANHGVELKCATVALEDTPQGQFLLTMLAAVGKLERAGILERTMRGKRQRVRNGKTLVGSSAPYGYDCVPETGTLVINEDEAHWVRSIFDWYLNEGLSQRHIARRLLEQGVPTKVRGSWAATTVQYILKNETYMGELYWGKTKCMGAKKNEAGIITTPGTRSKRPREEWIGPVAVPAIVSPKTFEAVQARFEYNLRMQPRASKSEYLLRSRLICCLCGRRLAGSSHRVPGEGRGYTYYICTGRTKLTAARCGLAIVRQDRVEREAWEWVIEHLSNPDLILRLVEQPGEAERRQRERDEADLKALLGLRADYERQENTDIELYGAGGITIDKFMARKKGRDERLEGIEKSIAEIEARQAQRLAAAQNLVAVKDLIQAVQGKLPALSQILTLKEKQDVLEVLQVRAVVNEDGTLNISALLTADILQLLDGRDEDGSRTVTYALRPA